ncbi:MAG: Do family serine endopeptidase [Rhodospirillales bacterium]|nr:Do family serine endopeptidase [Rhodospirillales bacterium]
MRLLVLAFAAALGLAAPVEAAAPIQAAGVPSLAPVLKEVTPGVVNIGVRARQRGVDNPLLADPFFRRFFNLPGPPQRPRDIEATGSGVIVDATNGYILTNNHVIENAEAVEVTTKDKRRFPAHIVGRDPETDVAVLKIEARNLKAVPLGDSDQLEVGDFVLAIGNPFGLGQTVTSGIVSALGRSGLGIEGYEDFIQTDASINPGNSGGALVDLHGRLVGINTAILAPGGGNIGIGFAVPINMARAVMEQILRYGEVKRGRVGIAIQELTPDLANALGTQRTEGAVVASVEPRSPAARAGLEPGDVVVAVDGVPIRSMAQLRNKIGLTRLGETIHLTIERKGQTKTVATKVEEAREARRENARTPRPR